VFTKGRRVKIDNVQFLKGTFLLIFLMIFFLAPRVSEAQELIQVSIHPNESMYVHASENIGIFSDVRNSGSFGSYPNSVISFSGERWSNLSGSRIVDESANRISGQGGYFKFRSPTSSPQIIDNQNNVQSNFGFPNLTIANSGNVSLEGSDLIIRRNLNFESGNLILNDRNAILPLNATITGFDNNKFVVTGTGARGGFLIMNSSGTQQTSLVFPVGTTIKSYTPASVNYKGIAQNIKVRVFDNVYDKATVGIPDNVNFAPKTWNLSFDANDPSAVITLSTQHSRNDEPANFTTNRSESFISRYLGTTGQWDKAASTGVGPGTLSTGGTIANAYLNTRAPITGLTSNEYFSKSVIKVSSVSGLRIPEGISPNNDGLNDKFVIENLKSGDKVRIDIYNRWQTVVFKDADYKNTFDGTGNQNALINKELPDGTYYYILNVNAEKPITGYIIINR
jgi:gliding motility-associated-like protein